MAAAAIKQLQTACRLSIKNSSRHTFKGVSHNDIHATAMEMECQGFVDSHLLHHLVPGQPLIHRVGTGPGSGLADIIYPVC